MKIFVEHFLGPNNNDKLAAQAKQKLTSTAYHKESHQWDFKKYIMVHTEQHTILSGLVLHGHAGIDK